MIPKQRQSVAEDDGQPYPAATLTDAIFGDLDAFGTLWAAHRLEVYRFVQRRIRDHHLAEDITSATCLRAMQKINGFSADVPGGGVAAWFVTIARNLIADHFKSSRQRRETVIEEWFDVDEPFLAVPVPTSCEDIVLTAIAHQAIHAAVQSLNPMQRACVEARFIDQLSVTETAELLDRNEGAVKALQYRAVRTLARTLTRDGRLTPEMLT